ncbi:HAMP domain-containing sensor histidine kinase [uncultured Sphingomonas sp.]|jgi:signal transduction histidine kinase|uniref:sensor histidine kinase n=2 Tax=Pseudomonadota TaxID=1224 RepID=UPI0025D072D3|nr:HAMP domain-containing sensor histidine kinase [uncultured Sphingomonas sp.]
MPDRAHTVRQITLFFTAGFALVTLLLGAGAYLLGEDVVHEQLDAQIIAETRALRAVAEEGDLAALMEALRRRDDRGVNSFGYLLTAPDGQRLGGELVTEALGEGWHDIRFRDPDGEGHPARSLVTRLPGGLQLTVAMESDLPVQLRNRLLFLFALGLVLLVAIAIVGSALFGRTIIGRLNTINRIASAVSRGQLDARIPVSQQNDEFDQLAATLNDMLDRNAAHIVNLRRVSSDVAHELRTPIMRLRLRMEQSLADAGEGTPEAAAIERSIADIDSILSLFAALLRIAEVEAGGLRAYFRPVALTATVEALAESYALAAEDGRRALVTRLEPGITVNGDRDLLAQIVVNLLENALRYTPPGARITLSLISGKDSAHPTVELTIADDGPGIAEADRARALQPFERMASGGSGHGLGLSLVAAIVASHGGTIELADNAPGLSVRIILPRMQKAAH